MNQPVRQGKSALFWILLATGGACGMCSLSIFGLMAFGLMAPALPAGPAGTVSTPMATGSIPTGETPNLYPGMPGWLPSGRGVQIPTAEEVDGEPRGLWWYSQVLGDGPMSAVATLYLAGGVMASNPRLGSGTLYDLEGQRAQKGVTGVGSFTVEDGVIRQDHDGFKSKLPLSFGTDEGGAYMTTGSLKLWPLTPPDQSGLVGTWRTAGGKYIFRADGTFESGQVDINGAYTLAVGGQGRYVLDGYLLQVSPNGAPSWINFVGATGDRFLVLGSRLYDRE